MIAPTFPTGPKMQPALAAIAAFLPLFETPGFVFGEWVNAESESGIVSLGHCSLGGEASNFIHAAYDNGLVVSFDWQKWAATKEAQGLRDDPAKLASASAQQLAKLLTMLIRQDRFAEGALLGAFKDGFLIAVVRRAAKLVDDQSSSHVQPQ